MSINRLDLLEALGMAKFALATTDFVAIYKHFIFTDGVVKAYNDAMMVEVPIDDMDCECAIQGAQLNKLLQSLSSDTVTFKMKDDESVELDSGNSSFSLPALPISEDIFEFPSDIDAPAVEFQVTTSFLRGLAKALTTVGDDDNFAWQMGVTLAQEDGDFVLYSTNNISISRFVAKIDKSKGELKTPIVLPSDFCRTLIRMTDIEGDEDVLLQATKDWVHVELNEGEQVIFTKILATAEKKENAGFSKIIANHVSDADIASAKLVDDEFFAIMNRAILFLSSETDKKVFVTVEGASISIDYRSRMGEGSETYEVKDAMADVELYADPAAIVRAGKVASKVFFNEDVTVFVEGQYTQLIRNLAEG